MPTSQPLCAGSCAVPDGDDKQRSVCESCGFINYRNPKIVVGCVVSDDKGRVLLGRRGIEPRAGLWGIPGGFMESNETLEEATIREAKEEMNADVNLKHLLAVLSVPSADQVHIYYAAEFKDPKQPFHSPGHETLETRLFDALDIPWKDYCFPTGAAALRHFFKTRGDPVVLPLQRSFKPLHVKADGSNSDST